MQIKIIAVDETSESRPGTMKSLGSVNSGELGGIGGIQGEMTQAGNVTWSQAKSIAAGGVLVKSMISYGLQNIERYTGDHLAQVRMNNSIQGLQLIAQAQGNPWIAMAQAAFNVTTTIADEQWRVKNENIKLNISRARNGYTDTKSILTSRRH